MCEIRVLAEKAVARVNRVYFVVQCGGHDPVYAEIALRRWRRADMSCFVGHTNVQGGTIGIGVHGDTPDVHLPQGTNDANRDLPAVGDEHLLEHQKAA